MDEFITESPVLEEITADTRPLTFPEAMQKVIDGEKITRLDWSNREVYGILKDGFLMIFIDGEFKQWIVNDGDMLAVDWVVIA